MKKEQILVLLFIIFSIFAFFLGLNYGKKSGNSDIGGLNGTGVLSDRRGKIGSGALLGKGTGSGSTSTGVLEKDVDTKTECEKIINGNTSEFIERMTGGLSLMLLYKTSIEVIEKNEFNELVSIKNGDCLNISTEGNRTFCNIFVSKDKNKISQNYSGGTMDYVLLTSLFTNTNSCSDLVDTYEVDSCLNILNIFNDDISEVEGKNILNASTLDKGKFYMKLGKEKYLTTLKKQFLNECNKLSLDK